MKPERPPATTAVSPAGSVNASAPETKIRHLNQVDLSRRWRMSPRTLERWRYEGAGPRYLHIGGRVLYRLEDILAFENDHLHSPGDEPPGKH